MSGRVGVRGTVAALVVGVRGAGAVRTDDLRRQAERAAHDVQFGAVRAYGRDQPALVVVGEGRGGAERIGAGQQVAARVVTEAGGAAEGVRGGQDPAVRADQVPGGPAVGGGERSGAVAGLGVGFGVGQGDLNVARLAALGDDPVPVVVDVVVATVVGVDPGDDAVAFVVVEGGDGTGGADDGGEVAGLVAVVVAHQRQVRAALPTAHQGERGHPPVGGGQSDLVARGVDEGQGQSAVRPVDGDGVAAPFADAGQPGSAVAAGFGAQGGLSRPLHQSGA